MKLSQAYRAALIAIAGFLLTAMFHRGAVAQANSSQLVRNVVIIHGAWADGSSWSKVIPLLQARGLHVVAVTNAAWKTKPSWCVITSNDRAVSPQLQKAEAVKLKATSITIPSSHVPMLTHPTEVADFIEQAAANAGNHIMPLEQ
jgi:pimeloyl-ACP methyl ester carboxylesterase